MQEVARRPAGRAFLMLIGICGFALAMGAAHAADQPATLDPAALDTVKVESEAIDTSTDESASVGHVPKATVDAHLNIRPGEVLETVPGLIVTQHSGEGKANQYFLRGYNLDHGTDLSVTVDDVPVNMRSHAHGQGYADLNFLIPELVSGIDYRKGPYYASEGDFAGAGAVHVNYLDSLPNGFATTSVDTFSGMRGLVADSTAAGQGNLLYALELAHLNGPWDHPDNDNKRNGLLRYSQGTADNGFNLTGWAYAANWNSTDQIAQRAINAVGRFGAIDPTDGGNAERLALTGKWQQTGADSGTKVNAYAVRGRMTLWNNFTYFLDDATNGDQFKQTDKRFMTGVNASHTLLGNWAGHDVENTLGTQVRNDQTQVGLFKTVNRRILSTTRLDDVDEASAGFYYENVFHWTDTFRTIAGVREDEYMGSVHSNLAANSGSTRDRMVSPKLGLVLGPWSRTEYYANWGRGFHSNDARGATITVDPSDGTTPQSKVPLLVQVSGTELGVRTSYLPRLQSSLALFQYDQKSELTFSGDAGTTEANRPSRRQGIEITNRYAANDWLNLEADFAYTRSRFTDDDDGLNDTVTGHPGNYIPGAVEGVGTIGANVDNIGRYYGGLLLRYFGSRPLLEDNSVRSRPTELLEARVGYKLTDSVRLQLDGFNLLDRKDSNISYYYESQLKGEAAGASRARHARRAHRRRRYRR